MRQPRSTDSLIVLKMWMPGSTPASYVWLKVLWLGSRYLVDRITVHHVPVLSSSVQVVNSARDLGVVIDSHLTMAITSPPYAAPPTFICDNYAWSQDHCLSMQQWRSCRVLLLVILTTVTLCLFSDITVCLGASSQSRKRPRDLSPALVDVIILLQCWGNSIGFRSDESESTSSWPSWSTRHFMIQLQCILLMTASSSLKPTIGRQTRVMLCSTDQHTVQWPELCSRWTAALEQSTGQDSPARQRHWRMSSAPEVVFV